MANVIRRADGVAALLDVDPFRYIWTPGIVAVSRSRTFTDSTNDVSARANRVSGSIGVPGAAPEYCEAWTGRLATQARHEQRCSEQESETVVGKHVVVIVFDQLLRADVRILTGHP